jgi:hypothetical protein
VRVRRVYLAAALEELAIASTLSPNTAHTLQRGLDRPNA